MIPFLMTLHVLIAAILIFVVLLQQQHKGGLGGIFGGTQSVLGERGVEPFLMKATIIFGSLFFLSSIFIALSVSNRNKNLQAPKPPVQQEEGKNLPLPTGGE